MRLATIATPGGPRLHVRARSGYVDVAEARWGLKRLLALPFDQLCPAHAPPMSRAAGRDFLLESLGFIDEVDAIAREMVERKAPAPVLTSALAVRIGELTGTDPPLTAQTVPTAPRSRCSTVRSRTPG